MENNFYVYQHIDEDGSIVYIGKGRYDRAWSMRRSSIDHISWLKTQLPCLEVIISHKDLDNTTALSIEKEMIQRVQPKYNKFYTESDSVRLIQQGIWLSSEKSRFNDSTLQKELGVRGAKSSKHPNNVVETCVHCGAMMNIGHINRYHNNNCKKRVSINDTN